MKVLKAFYSSSSNVALTILAIIFWIMRIQGIFNSTIFTDIFGFWDWVSTIIYVIIVFGIGGAIPIYLIISFTKFKKKWSV